MDRQTTKTKNIWSEIANFTGEFIDEKPVSTFESFITSEELGVLTEDEKKIFTLMKRKVNEIQELTETIIGPAGIKETEEEVFFAFDRRKALIKQRGTAEQKQKLKELVFELAAMSSILWGSINYRISTIEKNSSTVRIEQGWKIIKGISESNRMEDLLNDFARRIFYTQDTMFSSNEEKEPAEKK